MARGTAHNRTTILHLILTAFFLTSLTAAGSAATGADTYPGLNISIRTNQTGYTCSNGCSILVTLENSGPINGSITNLTLINRFSKTAPDRLGISTRFGTEDNFTYHGSYSNLDKISFPERQGQVFRNRSQDSAREPYTVQLRLNLTSATAQYWDIILRPGIDGANQDWYRNLSVRTELRTLQLVAPEDGYSPGDRQVTFRFLPDVPDVSRIPCAVRYDGATVVRNLTATGTTASLSARLHPGETAGSWHVWCDMDNDTVQEPGEISSTRSFLDREAPAITFGGVFRGRIAKPPGELAVRATDNFMGIEEARFSIVQDGVNRTGGGLSGTSILTRFENSSIFNAS
ncbi:MAG: hypothetical protein SVU32_06925, partial [Candidatus Nanohaloarchaea archaeon]|nr:hypothetical protein [Candidatus Nanohaloarchaea archaeon]